MSLTPECKRVFFLGMGTGITAGAAVTFEHIERIVVAELVPEVVELAKRHFRGDVRGLFSDERVRIRATDGRLLLATMDEEFDAIIGDLFVPWRRGVGSLFTKEHLEAASTRLAPGGLYAQWLPLYQMSRAEVECVVRTFATVFPQVTLWRGDFFSKRPILCVVGEKQATPYDFLASRTWFGHVGFFKLLEFGGLDGALPAMLFACRVEPSGSWPPAGPINTDDEPWLEFQAPVSARKRAAGKSHACTGTRYLAMLEAARDAHGSGLETYQRITGQVYRSWMEAGHQLHRSLILPPGETRTRARRAYEELVAEQARPVVSEWSE